MDPISGCPTATELVAVLGVGEGKEVLKNKDYNNGFDDFWVERSNWVWNYTLQVVRLDDLIVDNSDSSYGFQAMGMPPLPKLLPYPFGFIFAIYFYYNISCVFDPTVYIAIQDNV